MHQVRIVDAASAVCWLLLSTGKLSLVPRMNDDQAGKRVKRGQSLSLFCLCLCACIRRKNVKAANISLFHLLHFCIVALKSNQFDCVFYQVRGVHGAMPVVMALTQVSRCNAFCVCVSRLSGILLMACELCDSNFFQMKRHLW